MITVHICYELIYIKQNRAVNRSIYGLIKFNCYQWPAPIDYHPGWFINIFIKSYLIAGIRFQFNISVINVYTVAQCASKHLPPLNTLVNNKTDLSQLF